MVIYVEVRRHTHQMFTNATSFFSLSRVSLPNKRQQKGFVEGGHSVLNAVFGTLQRDACVGFVSCLLVMYFFLKLTRLVAFLLSSSDGYKGAALAVRALATHSTCTSAKENSSLPMSYRPKTKENFCTCIN